MEATRMSTLLLLLLLLLCVGHSWGQRQAVTVARLEKTPLTLLYDYRQVLDLSLLFYEAQRSGKLPRDNRVPWRGDSCLDCVAPDGSSLAGGYYTTGNALKFTFPNAGAATLLAWGVFEHQKTYEAAGLLVRAQQAVTWGADYLVQCHFGHNLVAFVGDDPTSEYDKWIRPEDRRGLKGKPRGVESLNLTVQAGSDLAGEVAAALAASALVVRDLDPARAALYLRHAAQLYDAAVDLQGSYSDSAPKSFQVYRSWHGYQDELVWASMWLFKATLNQTYLKNAEDFYEEFDFHNRVTKDEFSWDDKTVGAKVLLYEATYLTSDKYKTDAKVFCDSYANNPRYWTKKGLFDRSKTWSTLRYASNAAYLCFELGEMLRDDKSERYAENPYLGFALQQVNYALGAAGRSFLVGFGTRWPKFVRHVGSSCPAIPAPCTLQQFTSPLPNPNPVLGGLVGGPGSDDGFGDERSNEQQNVLSVDTNAGFQSAVVALLGLHNKGSLPQRAYGCKYAFTVTNVPSVR